MRRRNRLPPPRIEPPAWYVTFDPAQWDDPDLLESRMMRGNLGCPWPDALHAHHVRRRWEEAKYRYGREHPAFGTQEFNDLLARVREPVRGSRGDSLRVVSY